MKTLIFISCLLLGNSTFSQSSLLVHGRMPIDSFYEKTDELLIYSTILEFADIKKEELIKRTKNWGATRFVNLKEVLFGETDDQLVFNYIDKNMFIKALGMNSSFSWYIRLVIQFKDGKMRTQYFDDGNTFQPGGQYNVSTPARKNHLVNYFKEDDGVLLGLKNASPGLASLKQSIKLNASDLKVSVTLNQVKKDEW
jgi:hypothetical protein